MDAFKQYYKVSGWIIFVISFLAFLTTMAPTLSYWDCGEFAACAHRMGVTHPPGSPFFLLLGRVFSMLPFSDIFHPLGLSISSYDPAFRITMMSVFSSAFGVLFLYLITVRLILQFVPTPKSRFDFLKIILPSAIGAFTFAFTYSHWFNAVESEVYAMSNFLSAIVIWLAMVWLEKPDDLHSDVYLLLIAYIIGLAIGVHLYNILCLPFIFFIIYSKKYEITPTSFLKFLGLSLVGIFFVYKVIIFYSVEIPEFFDKYGLGTVSVLALFAVMIYTCYYLIKTKRHAAAVVAISTLLIFVGYSTYAMIIIRSGMNPNIDMNDPEHWKSFASFLNREQYGEISLFPRIAPFWEYQIKKMYVRYFNWQFIGRPDEIALSLIDYVRNAIGWTVDRTVDTELDQYNYMYKILSARGLYGLPFLVGLIGAYHHFKKDWKHALATLGLFLATGLAVVIYLNNKLPEPRERDYTFVGSFFAFSIWIGIGAYAILDFIKQKLRRENLVPMVSYAAVALMFVVLPLNMYVYNKWRSSRQDNYVAYDFSRNMLETVEPNAIIFTNGDNDTYPLWYMQEVENIRTDVRVINLSLIQTPWYIKQMKNLEPEYHLRDGSVVKGPKAPISYSDEAIDNLQPRPWKTRRLTVPVPRDTYWREWLASGKTLPAGHDTMSIPPVTFDVKPTLYDRYLGTKDIMILDMLYTSQWNRPIYFAITVSDDNKVGLERYLRMDGLAQKIVPIPDQRLSPKRIYDNLFSKYQFRNMNNPDVSYDDNIERLTTNCRTLFFELARTLRNNKNARPSAITAELDQVFPELESYDEKIIKVLDTMEELFPDDVIALRNWGYKVTVGQFYSEAGQPEKLDRFMRQILANPMRYKLDEPGRVKIGAAYFYILKDYDMAIEVLEPIVDRDPANGEAMGWYVQALESRGSLEKAIEVLNNWLIRNPTDQGAQDRINKLQAKLGAFLQNDSTKSE